MSLHTIAKHMAAQGRGPDKQLIHMSDREVAGLQALAKAHGGSLTINPHTGLAEAGFLDRLLPTLLGAGLAFTGVGAPMAALMVGGLQTARTGSLGQGIMAGLGAYGGAGLAGGLGAGAAPTPEVAPTAAPAAPATPAAPVAEAPLPPTSAAGTNFTATPADPITSQMSPNQYAAQATNNGFGDLPFEPRPGVTPENYGANFSTGPTSTSLAANPSAQGIGSLTPKESLQYGAASLGSMMDTKPKPLPTEEKYNGPLSKYKMSEDYKPYEVQQPNPYYMGTRYAYGMAGGGPVERMSDQNAIGANTGYPQANINQGAYATPWQTPISRNMVTGSADTGVNPMTGEMSFAGGGGISGLMSYAGGGSLGGYSDGGHMLKGPGDGMSDSIPAKIGSKQPARLADGEFVVPADVVSHLGNGSSDAGAKQLYKMMDRIRSARTGKKRQAPQVNPSKSMPA